MSESNPEHASQVACQRIVSRSWIKIPLEGSDGWKLFRRTHAVKIVALVGVYRARITADGLYKVPAKVHPSPRPKVLEMILSEIVHVAMDVAPSLPELQGSRCAETEPLQGGSGL